ncbi:MAG: hypothetical protein ACRCV4_16125, partial [Hafnia alvei]
MAENLYRIARNMMSFVGLCWFSTNLSIGLLQSSMSEESSDAREAVISAVCWCQSRAAAIASQF